MNEAQDAIAARVAQALQKSTLDDVPLAEEKFRVLAAWLCDWARDHQLMLSAFLDAQEDQNKMFLGIVGGSREMVDVAQALGHDVAEQFGDDYVKEAGPVFNYSPAPNKSSALFFKNLWVPMTQLGKSQLN